MQIKSKLPNSGISIFAKMTALANQHGAINLAQGFPDFPSSVRLIENVYAAMRRGFNQYAPMPGVLSLRERIAEKVSTIYGSNYSPDSEITITAGATQAIYTAITAIIREGEEVIIFEPAYDSYAPAIRLSGGVPVPVALHAPDYSIDWEMVKKNVSQRTRMILINTPHNPTGAVLSKQDIIQLEKIVEGKDIFILSDEVYEHLIFDGKQHESMLRYPDLYERSFVCFSFGKVYNCTGWKLGYCVAPPALMKEFRKVHQFNCFSCNSPVQFALTEFVQQKENYLQLGSFLQQKRDYLKNLMQQTKFKALPSYGSYFQLYSYSGITDESEKDFAIRLTKEYGVATIPTSVFYKNGEDNKVLRFCFSKKENTLEEAANRLMKL